jgi:hypothetical protein
VKAISGETTRVSRNTGDNGTWIIEVDDSST